MTDQTSDQNGSSIKSLQSVTEPTIQQASLKNGIILALFALISTGLIAVVHLMTKDRIADEIESAMARRLNQVILASEYDNDVYSDCIEVNNMALLATENSKIYRMRNKKDNYALFITSVAPDGYAGKINLVIGVYSNGKIAGVRVTEHKETPGLGDKIEIKKSNWIKGFDNKSLQNTSNKYWQVKKDGGEFDALTGATITPRAIVNAVFNTLTFYQQNKDQLYSLPSNCGAIK
jgi:Na+-translocating ferredoxin:NAD+ oxidoreductase subunit G